MVVRSKPQAQGGVRHLAIRTLHKVHDLWVERKYIRREKSDKEAKTKIKAKERGEKRRDLHSLGQMS